MGLFLFGINHKSASLDLRQRFALDPQARATVIKQLVEASNIAEACILSTCNRVEVIVHASAIASACESVFQTIYGALATQSNTPPELYPSSHFYKLQDGGAVHHFFQVAASLDSLVIGEAQILGQVKEAYEQAQAAGTVGPILHKLFQKAFFAAKRVRTETQIGTTPVSLASATVSISESIFESLDDKTVMLIGSGKMALSALCALKKHSLKRLLVAGRNPEKTAELAAQLGGEAIGMDTIAGRIGSCDLAIVSTSSKTPLLFASELATARKGMSQHPLFIIDISVPRNVEKTVHFLENIFLYDMDDLQKLIEKNRQFRHVEMAHAQKILDEETSKFSAWLALKQTAPLIQELTEKAEAIRLREIGNTLSKLTTLSDEERMEIDIMTRNIVSKIIHDPMVNVKERHVEEDSQTSYSITQAFKTLFQLKGERP